MKDKMNKYVTIKKFAEESGLSIADIKYLCINHMIPHMEFNVTTEGAPRIRYKIHLERGLEALLRLETEVNTNKSTVPVIKKAKKITTKDCLNELKKTIKV